MKNIEPLFKTRRDEIKAYCDNNGLDYSKLRKCGICGGASSPFMFQHIEHVPRDKIFIDSPAPVVLIVDLHEGKLRIRETEHTREYLV